MSADASVTRKPDIRQPQPVVLSATFRDTDTDAREALAARLSGEAPGLGEWALLHTCHRVELVGVAANGSWSPPPAPGLRFHWGAEAVERLLIVAGGLDSAVVAEEQLQGQVRAAYEAALAAGQTGPILNELLRRAIRFGRRVRSLAQPGGDRSLAARAVRWVDERLGPEVRPASALVIGTGEMGRLLATELSRRGMRVTIASRSLERAQRLAGELEAHTIPLAALQADALRRVARDDVVALALRPSRPILEREHLAAAAPPPLVIDLSTPRAVSEEASLLLGDRLVDLDRLGSSEASSLLSPAAERRLRAEAAAERDRFMDWLRARESGDGVRLLTGHAREVRRRHLDRLRRSGRLNEEQMAAVEAATSGIVGELLHEPIRRLKADPEAAAAVRRIFGLQP